MRYWRMAGVGSTLFDRWSAVYDRPSFQDATYRPVHDAVLVRLADTRPELIVDLGCGTAQLTRRLIERFPTAEVVGVDYSAGMLTQARDRLADTAALVRADATHPPFRPGSVDVVVCTESFHWYRDQERTLSSLATVLRPGGRLLIASIAAVTTVGQSALQALSTGAGQPVRARTPRQLRSLLHAADFEVLHQRRVPRVGLIPWPVLTDVRRR